MNKVQKSKYLSLILRHKPDKAGITIDKNGWADIEEILKAVEINREQLEDIVETNNKKRFKISDDGTKIRANQGHSINVNVELKRATPPPILFHGTGNNYHVIQAIKKDGLKKMNRQHVHLSPDRETAIKVGKRHVRYGSDPVILTVDAALMAFEGLYFYLSENGVWLTDNVPAKYLHGF